MLVTVGERIKYYREIRGLSQRQLSSLSGVPIGTIKAYETGSRNPKDTALQRIADTLHISITAFQDIQLETLGDVAPYIFAISKLGEVEFHGKKKDDGKFDIDDLSISFKSPVMKYFMKEWADSKSIIDHLRDEAASSPDTTAKEYLLSRADEIEHALELRMVDSQMLVKQQKK